MKSLNKKISAIVLAGMVVMGGVLSSGVSSFAAVAKNKVSVQKYPDSRVKFYCKGFGDIIGVYSKKDNIDKIYDNRNCYNNGRPVKVKYLSQIQPYLYKAQYSEKQFLILDFNDIYYLIKIK